MANRFIRKIGLAGRSHDPVNRMMGHQNPGPIVLDRNTEDAYEIGLRDIYGLAKRCHPIRRSIQTMRDYLFKEGWAWSPKFSGRCGVCEKEFPPDAKPEFCGDCGSKTFIEPDDGQIEVAEDFFKRVNANNHTLMEELKIYEDHLNIADDSFMLVHKDYETDDEGYIVGWEVKELTVADPRNFRIIVDPKTMTPGNMVYICLKCSRSDPEGAGNDIANVYNSALSANKAGRHGRAYPESGTCDECGMVLYDVWYVSLDAAVGTATKQMVQTGPISGVVEFYIGDVVLEDGRTSVEVIYNSKYSNTYGYGTSPVVSVWEMAHTLLAMERYVRTFYEEERMPRAALFIPTRNPDSIGAVWKSAEDRNVSQDGHYVPKITYDPGDAGGNRPVQYLEFSKPPAEMQMLETNDYYYKRISMAWGVSPVFQGSSDMAGLQDTGPTQWAVTELAAEVGQWIYNEKVLPLLLEQLGVDEWNLELIPVEEQSEAEKIQVDIMKANLAQMMQMLGFAPTERTPEGDFVFPQKPQQQDPFGGMGGMGGGMGGGMPPPPPGTGAMGGPPDGTSPPGGVMGEDGGVDNMGGLF